MRILRIDKRTVIEIPDGEDPIEAKRRFEERLNESRQKWYTGHIAYHLD